MEINKKRSLYYINYNQTEVLELTAQNLKANNCDVLMISTFTL